MSETSSASASSSGGQEQSWSDLGREMWTYLTGRGAAIDYTFENMQVQVPRDTGAEAPRATWVLDGTLRITTSDRESGSGAAAGG